ncbi:undecaprenyl-phosphate glucose phosphotransferase [Marinobacteraceae bacterium S3BR75-40.1]
MKTNAIPRLDQDQRARFLFRLGDVFAMVTAADITYLIKFQHLAMPDRYLLLMIVAAVFASLVFPSLKVYEGLRVRVKRLIIARLLNGYVLTGLFLVSVLFISKTSADFSRAWILAWMGLGLLGSVMVRAFLSILVKREFEAGGGIRSVMLIGTGHSCGQILEKVSAEHFGGYRATSIKVVDGFFDGLPDWAEPLEDETVLAVETDEVWLCMPLSMGEYISEINERLRFFTGNIRYIPDLTGLQLLNHEVVNIAGFFAINLSCSPIRGVNGVLKAIEDYVLASLILIIISPLMLLLAVGVKLSSKGPVFYRQERIGWNGKPFKILKFRSMPVETEKEGVVWGKGNAKVNTAFGRFIRRYSLDELPQFLNVIKGEMSIVGPRPERTRYVDEFKYDIPGYMRKHMVKAGITGWAQVNGWRGDTDLKTRIDYDLYYIDNWSIWFDIRIIFMTVLGGFFERSGRDQGKTL